MNNELPLVSVISGYYNREHLVDESIQSLLDQTYSNLEIIIFDDCSTDNTYQKLKKFELDARVKILRNQHNKGFTKSLKDTIAVSKGEFIAIHGSGDFSFPTRIEKQAEVLQKDLTISVVGCENETFTEKGIASKTQRFPAGNFLSDMKKERIKISGGDAMFRRSTYYEVGGHREFFKYAQDFDLWCRMSLKSEYYIVQEVLYRRGRFIKGTVSGTPKTRVKQIMYGAMAIESLKMREDYGYDFVDLLGIESFTLLGRTKRLSKKLSVHALRLYLDSNIEDFEMVINVLKKQKFSMRKLFVLLIYYNLIPKFLLNLIRKDRSIIKKVKNSIIK